ncbi:hypothetical protein, partial [Mesorhizobium sp.]|uniref:hypothetical protein n=1 Tax=Mesorhizobium sp. TaxID=1871066 RepID=UPI00257BCAFF
IESVLQDRCNPDFFNTIDPFETFILGVANGSNAPNLSRSSTLSSIPNPAFRSVVVMGSSQYVQSNGLAAIRRHDPAAGAKSASRKKRAGR